jgi:hypothetical protein
VSNPTNPFSWQMPTPTDLVTDLPADFEVFGQAVATSLADLLGGTTDQVLAKNSNTDMDFKWVTSDDANAIQNTIVDAKGDLIAASANDTPARLAVGANNLYVMADSGAATGLSYGGNWTAFTPNLANMTLGNGTAIGRYQRVGNTVFVYFRFTLGSTSTVGTNPFITLPTGTTNMVSFSGSTNYLDSGVIQYTGKVELAGGNGCFFVVDNVSGTYSVPSTNLTATVPFTWTTNDIMTAYFWYEVA